MARRKSTRKYGPKASEDVERAMREMKQGKLHSGRSGKTVTNPRQAIAIGLSEARKEGAKLPPYKPGRTRSKSSR
jgi:hypothetical protein